MRALSAAALFLLIPAVGCINVDLGNEQPNVFEAQIDATAINPLFFGKKNINFRTLTTLDPTTDEARLGVVAADFVGGDPITIEFAYSRPDMIKLEDLLTANADPNADPRGLVDTPQTFQVTEPLTPFTVAMFVTFTRIRKITNDNGGIRRIKEVQTIPASCNFIDPINADAKGCLTFTDEPLTAGVDNIIGNVGGVGGETTISATFDDLIVVDPQIFSDVTEDFLLQGKSIDLDPVNNPDFEELQDALADSILIRIARNKQGKVFVFNSNLDVNLE
jgi:hypothetical protein